MRIRTKIIIGITVFVACFSFYIYLTGFLGFGIFSIVAVILIILAYFNQNMFLYIPIVPGQYRSPSRNAFGLRHPNQHDLQSIDLCLVTIDGVRIRGWHIKANKTKRIIIYFHQNAGNIGNRLYYVKNLVKTQSDVVLVAYRGYSDSQSYPSEQGIMKDAAAIMQYTLNYSKEHRDIPIYILGRSLGGAVAIYIASRQAYKHKIRGIIIQNTFCSIKDMVDAILPFLKPLKFLVKNYWQSVIRITQVKSACLFIKCLNDQIVPCQQMERLMKAAKCPIKQYIIQDGNHNVSWINSQHKYFGEFQQFFHDLEH